MARPILLARYALSAAIAASLAGCTNDSPVMARVAGANIDFAGRDDSADASCVGSLRIADARGTTMWEIEALGAKGENLTCATHLPVAYGIAPPGFRTIAAARPLIPGTYRLTGSGQRFLRGAFRYAGPGQPLENFSAGSAAWCAAQYPGTKPDWLGQCRMP